MGSSASSNKSVSEILTPVPDHESDTKIERKNLSDGHYISDKFGPRENFIQIKFDGSTLFQRICTVEYGTVSNS